jgi:hypothetical protein
VLLNFVFLVHAAFALVVALLLLFYPDWFTQMATGITWTGGTMADVATVYARFSAAGLILVVIVSSYARQSGYTNARMMAVLSMIVISLVALIVSWLVPFNPLRNVSLLVNLLFILAYAVILYFYYEEI